MGVREMRLDLTRTAPMDVALIGERTVRLRTWSYRLTGSFQARSLTRSAAQEPPRSSRGKTFGRRSVLIELNETYCEMAARRLGQQSLLAEGAA